MNTITGEIVELPPGPQPEHMKMIGKLPDPDCPICRGKGHTGKPQNLGTGRKPKWRYIPCSCLNAEPEDPGPDLIPAGAAQFSREQIAVIEAVALAHQTILFSQLKKSSTRNARQLLEADARIATAREQIQRIKDLAH